MRNFALVFCLLAGTALGQVPMNPNQTKEPKPEKRTLPKPAASTLSADYDPLAQAIASTDQIRNWEATVPPQCYTKTEGVSNPCWTCHTVPVIPNELDDWELQEEYAFSDFALNNRWSNLFKDRTTLVAAISDKEALEWVRVDNYTALRQALSGRDDYPGYVPELDFQRGFDSEGFAIDGSQWRAIRYKPFLGTFWPTNGSTDDVFIRLPEKFRTKDGVFDREVYKANFAILEALIAAGPKVPRGDAFRYRTAPIDETAAGADFNRDGELTAGVTEIVGTPSSWVGDAAGIPIRRYVHPAGTEYLHSVRYLDPDRPGMMAQRMKELRYSRKIRYLDSWEMSYWYEREYNEKEEGNLPQFPGSPMVGLLNDFGWQLQGFIEDAEGRLRLQTHEEHQFCMGCHSALGVTVDQTFTLARKVPGSEGWKYQDIVGIQDVPQQFHPKPEIATYMERVKGGDEFRANSEMIERFFENGKLISDEIARAAPGGDKDISHLVVPSRERALLLNKAYMVVVREQSFQMGRDAIIGTVDNIHPRIENGSTALGQAGLIFTDGRLWLDWDWEPESVGNGKGETTKPTKSFP